MLNTCFNCVLILNSYLNLLTEYLPICNLNEVDKIRCLVYISYQKNPTNFELIDIEQKIENQSWFIKNFLINEEGNLRKATIKLIAALKWRKSFNLSKLNANYFPIELYRMGCLFDYKFDKKGTKLLYFRGKLTLNNQNLETINLLKQFLVYQYEKIDVESNGNWAIITDATDSGLSNIDSDFSFFNIQIMQDYYPAIKYIWIYNLPWLLKGMSKVMLNFMSDQLRSKVIFDDEDELDERIGRDNLPYFLGGLAEDYRIIPEGSLKLDKADHLGFDFETLEKTKYFCSYASRLVDQELRQ